MGLSQIVSLDIVLYDYYELFLAVKMVTNKEEKEVVELVGYILAHVLYSYPSLTL